MDSPSSMPFFSFILVFAAIPVSLSLPFVVLHGIGNQCSSQGLKNFTESLSNYSGVEGYCVEVGNGVLDSWFMPLEKQAGIVCEKVQKSSWLRYSPHLSSILLFEFPMQVKKMEELKKGYSIVGLSQGNLIGRGVVEFCDGAPPVKNFISLAGPHAGIASVPLCGSAIFCRFADELIKSEIYSDYVQDHLAPSGFLKLPNAIPKYLAKCKFLPKLNNELPQARNSTYKQRFSSLQNLVLIMFEHDTVLVPRETSWFGYYKDGAFNSTIPPQETKLYIEDWIGLKTLDKAGRVKYISVAGEHVKISNSDMRKYVVPYLQG
ncbi:palmitoyl-protein thioesterase 1-like isoform X1 [Cucurbita pepo subsp. pepo]|uniref:palmitoyl-protein thioesterase 1-like isoform X1 n=1 Tax=Cucurbita pepo subsp. pepo TaxID=3664 RepID=UPI000C9D2800|nr:palmitoyl-protein thioesterase 1-like isoform X1 [Cucurbita pepo subsp. pepo]